MGMPGRPWQIHNVNQVDCFNKVFLLLLLIANLQNIPQEWRRKRVTFSVLLALFLLNLVNPGFPSLRCDASILLEPNFSHKYEGDTVPTLWLLFMAVVVPAFQIFITELLYNQHVRRGSYSVGNSKETSRFKRCTMYAARWYRDYIFGLIFTVFVNDIAKTTMSAPRPHFIDTCKPNFTKEACYMGWVHDYECANPNATRWRIIDARKSFPSGHAAIAMYSALFMILYQHNRINVKKLGNLTILWAHLLWLGWGVFCALSRVADNRHHPVDITFGGIIGTAGGIFSSVILCKLFQEKLSLEPFQRQVLAGVVGNGSATILEGYSTDPTIARIDMTSGANNGAVQVQQQSNGEIKRPSLRRLLSTQSTMTQMSDISEDRELENV